MLTGEGPWALKGEWDLDGSRGDKRGRSWCGRNVDSH